MDLFMPINVLCQLANYKAGYGYECTVYCTV
jgi:hypothetical protein